MWFYFIYTCIKTLFLVVLVTDNLGHLVNFTLKEDKLNVISNVSIYFDQTGYGDSWVSKDIYLHKNFVEYAGLPLRRILFSYLRQNYGETVSVS